MRLRAFALAVLFAGRALAQPAGGTSTADTASALYVEGKELRDAGDLKKSLEKLEAAHALFATPITALEVGRARALVGHLRGAIDALESIERLPRKANESPKASSARSEASTLLAQYRARVPKIALHVEGADVRVTVDGEVVPSDQRATPWLVDPGAHHIEASRGERHAAQDVRLAEGEQRDVTLTFDGPLPLAPAPTPAPPLRAAGEPPPVVPRDTARPNVVAWVGFGLGAAGLATGTVTGILTLARASDIKPQCADGVCPSSAGLGSAQSLGTVSTVAFIAGGVGVGVGVLALVFAPSGHDSRKAKGAWVEPWVGGTALGLRGGF